MRNPRVSLPITLTSGLVAVTIALTVGWQILVTREFQAFAEGFTAVHWMLVSLGSLFFVLIITVAILQAARTEVRRSGRESVDLGALLRDCVGEARGRHGLDDDSVRLDVPPQAWVRGDMEQLRVAFRNLIENAIRYAGPKIDVDVRVRPLTGRKIEVEVADQGPGIPPNALTRIFQRFQRVSHDTVRPTRGLGLGLYIVRNVVRAHGGSVRAESEGEGTGSRFIVTLPRAV